MPVSLQKAFQYDQMLSRLLLSTVAVAIAVSAALISRQRAARAAGGQESKIPVLGR